jgi:uncharacterized protein
VRRYARSLAPPAFLAAPVRQADSVDETGHRPWALPEVPWLMGQTWEGLLFAHWPVPPGMVRALVPLGLEVETFDGTAWLGITPFRVDALRLRGLPPAPGMSRFLELNVRTDVTRDGKPGIWFFSLDAASRLAVEAARRAYRLPYHQARMRARRDDDIHYGSTRIGTPVRPYVFSARYRATGTPATTAPGSREHFLTERYCLYAVHDGRVHRAEIHHPPWPIQPAEGEIELNTMPPDGIELPEEPPLLHFAAVQDVVIWPLENT